MAKKLYNGAERNLKKGISLIKFQSHVNSMVVYNTIKGCEKIECSKKNTTPL